jgi:hypothetical protein
MATKSAKVAKKTMAKRDGAKMPRKAMPNPTERSKLLSGGSNPHSRLTRKSHCPKETRMIRVSAAQYFWFGYATSPAEEGTRAI